jgi:hypothetical protein
MSPLAPLFVHVHVPKCAGTSFNHLLQRSFGTGFMGAYTNAAASSYSLAELDALVRGKPWLRCIASHSIRRFPRPLADRQPLYVCFLRDPIERLISNYTYLIHHWDQLTPEHRAALHPDTPRMTLRELAAERLEQASSKFQPPTLVDFFADAYA